MSLDGMTVLRVAAFSVHTSPLAPPGRGDGGGMNVYVSSLASALAHAGVECDVFTRRTANEPDVIEVEPGLRVLHLDAGPRAPIAKEQLAPYLGEFAARARSVIDEQESGYDILHGHYWMSGAVAHRLKHELGLPLVSTFHTLALVKAAAGIVDVTGSPEHDRAKFERDIVRCSDLVLASTELEERDLVTRYGADPGRIEVLAPGVDHERFRPDDRGVARRRLGIAADEGVVLFAGRIQPLKGADLAVRTVAELGDASAQLILVGDPSGPDGDRELQRVRGLARTLGIEHRVRFVGAVAHDALAAYYRAADVCIVPSRSESFGLVALEAASCGTPVVASAVGGLQSIVDDGVTGYLIDSREPHEYAAAVAKLLGDRRARRRHGAGGCHRGASLLVAHHGRAPAAALRRSRDHRARPVSLSPSGARRSRAGVSATDTPDPRRYEAALALLHEHLEGSVAHEPFVQVVEFDPEIPRWYVRFGCDGRDAATIYFDLHQRSLHHEVYFLPDPHYRHEDVYRLLLQANHQAYGTRASIAADGELYLTGRTLLEHLDADRARPHHRIDLHLHRAMVPRGGPPRLPAARRGVNVKMCYIV